MLKIAFEFSSKFSNVVINRDRMTTNINGWEIKTLDGGKIFNYLPTQSENNGRVFAKVPSECLQNNKLQSRNFDSAH
jgi:hypothetical protein